jgi:hypothetical protein
VTETSTAPSTGAVSATTTASPIGLDSLSIALMNAVIVELSVFTIFQRLLEQVAATR